MNTVFACARGNILRPQGRLDFTDVSLSQVVHADTRLADAASYSIGQLAVQQRFLERKFSALFASCELELSAERLFVHADTHGRKLQPHIKDRIVYDDVSV